MYGVPLPRMPSQSRMVSATLVSGSREGSGDYLYDVYFTEEKIFVVCLGRRRTLCRVALGFSGMRPEPASLEELVRNTNGSFILSYDELSSIILEPRRFGTPPLIRFVVTDALSKRVIGGSRDTTFSLNEGQYKVIKSFLEGIPLARKK